MYKPSVYRVWRVTPSWVRSGEPVWGVRSWDVELGAWRHCSHASWQAAMNCVNRGWILFGKVWK